MHRRSSVPVFAYLIGWLCVVVSAGSVNAQPTYKLDVKPNLKPEARLQLAGIKLSRSEVRDDPGFRLQYHFKKNNATVSAVEARSNPALDLPMQEAGVYSVALELFYPNYKGGTAQKGEFKPISNVLTYKVEGPGKVILLDAGLPTLVVQCGRGKGTLQDEVVGNGYAYRLVQGTPFDGWPSTSGKTHAWLDPKAVVFEVTVPPGTAGTLRLLFVDADNLNRKHKLTVAGKPIADFDAFTAAGKFAILTLTKEDAKSGKIEVNLTNLNPMSTAAVSFIEFIPAPVLK